jgi:hypothetical protein
MVQALRKVLRMVTQNPNIGLPHDPEIPLVRPQN